MRGLVEYVSVSSLANDVRLSLDWGNSISGGLLLAHVESVAVNVRSFTRGNGWVKAGNGWTVAEDLAGVIVSCSVRSLSNPEQVRRMEAGTFSALPGDPGSWSLREYEVLTDYRDMAG